MGRLAKLLWEWHQLRQRMPVVVAVANLGVLNGEETPTRLWSCLLEVVTARNG